MAGFHFVPAHQSYKVRYIALKRNCFEEWIKKKKVSQDSIREDIPHGQETYGFDNSLTLLVGETFPLFKIVLYFFMSYLNQVAESLCGLQLFFCLFVYFRFGIPQLISKIISTVSRAIGAIVSYLSPWLRTLIILIRFVDLIDFKKRRENLS